MCLLYKCLYQCEGHSVLALSLMSSSDGAQARFTTNFGLEQASELHEIGGGHSFGAALLFVRDGAGLL